MRIGKDSDRDDLEIPGIGHVTFFPCGSQGDRSSHLLAHIRIGPVDMHLEAVAVAENEAGEQIGADPTCAEMLDHLYRAFEPDRAYQTVKLGGRRYVIFAAPFVD